MYCCRCCRDVYHSDYTIYISGFVNSEEYNDIRLCRNCFKMKIEDGTIKTIYIGDELGIEESDEYKDNIENYELYIFGDLY